MSKGDLIPAYPGVEGSEPGEETFADLIDNLPPITLKLPDQFVVPAFFWNDGNWDPFDVTNPTHIKQMMRTEKEVAKLTSADIEELTIVKKAAKQRRNAEKQAHREAREQ